MVWTLRSVNFHLIPPRNGRKAAGDISRTLNPAGGFIRLLDRAVKFHLPYFHSSSHKYFKHEEYVFWCDRGFSQRSETSKNMTLRNTLFFSVWSLCRRVSVQCFLLSQQLNEAFVSVDPESQTSYELESRPAAFKTNKSWVKTEMKIKQMRAQIEQIFCHDNMRTSASRLTMLTSLVSVCRLSAWQTASSSLEDWRSFLN